MLLRGAAEAWNRSGATETSLVDTLGIQISKTKQYRDHALRSQRTQCPRDWWIQVRTSTVGFLGTQGAIGGRSGMLELTFMIIARKRPRRLDM